MSNKMAQELPARGLWKKVKSFKINTGGLKSRASVDCNNYGKSPEKLGKHLSGEFLPKRDEAEEEGYFDDFVSEMEKVGLHIEGVSEHSGCQYQNNSFDAPNESPLAYQNKLRKYEIAPKKAMRIDRQLQKLKCQYRQFRQHIQTSITTFQIWFEHMFSTQGVKELLNLFGKHIRSNPIPTPSVSTKQQQLGAIIAKLKEQIGKLQEKAKSKQLQIIRLQAENDKLNTEIEELSEVNFTLNQRIIQCDLIVQEKVEERLQESRRQMQELTEIALKYREQCQQQSEDLNERRMKKETKTDEHTKMKMEANRGSRAVKIEKHPYEEQQTYEQNHHKIKQDLAVLQNYNHNMELDERENMLVLWENYLTDEKNALLRRESENLQREVELEQIQQFLKSKAEELRALENELGEKERFTNLRSVERSRKDSITVNEVKLGYLNIEESPKSRRIQRSGTQQKSSFMMRPRGISECIREYSTEKSKVGISHQFVYKKRGASPTLSRDKTLKKIEGIINKTRSKVTDRSSSKFQQLQQKLQGLRRDIKKEINSFRKQ